MSRSQRTVLIDADVLCHQFAYRNTATFSYDGETTVSALQPEKAKVQVESYALQLRDTVKGGKVILVLSDRGSNFRKELDPTYKAKRIPKPELWEVIRTFIEEGGSGFPTISFPRLEGDDTLGILATGNMKGSILVSIDKDMQTVPGLLYNPQKPERGLVPVSELDARRYHMLQTLTGDTVDEYKGCPGIGEVKASAALAGLTEPAELWAAVVAVYESKGLTEADALHQARLAFILHDGYYRHSDSRIRLWKPQTPSASSA